MLVFPGINYATKGEAYQKSTYGDAGEINKWSAGLVIDGKINGRFSNTEQVKAGEWWKVDLRRKIIFQFARIYARDGNCDGDPCGMIFILITKSSVIEITIQNYWVKNIILYTLVIILVISA